MKKKSLKSSKSLATTAITKTSFSSPTWCWTLGRAKARTSTSKLPPSNLQACSPNPTNKWPTKARCFRNSNCVKIWCWDIHSRGTQVATKWCSDLIKLTTISLLVRPRKTKEAAARALNQQTRQCQQATTSSSPWFTKTSSPLRPSVTLDSLVKARPLVKRQASYRTLFLLLAMRATPTILKRKLERVMMKTSLVMRQICSA